MSYNEVRRYGVKDSFVDVGLVREGEKPEMYTEEHEKLLGTYENEWVLFVDGYDSNHNRIYDQVTGKTCHQCRYCTFFITGFIIIHMIICRSNIRPISSHISFKSFS